MHEISVCRGLIHLVERVAVERRAKRVVSVTVRIGPLSGVEAQLLRSAYPLVSIGTVAQTATLIVELLPVRVRCLECGAQSETDTTRLVCACCGQRRVQLLGGDELLLASVELERDQA